MTKRKARKGKKTRQPGKRDAAKPVHDERQVELLPDVVPKLDGAGDLDGEEPLPTEADSVVVEDEASPAPAHAEGGPPEGSAEKPLRPAGNELARARDLVEDGRVHEAIDLYREIVSQKPESVRAHNNLGVLFDELGQHDSAVGHFEEALRLEPENVEVLTNHASALTSLHRYDAAEVVVRRAMRLAPEDVAVRVATGVLSFRRGLYAQAELELRWVCEREPHNGPAFYYRGEALNRVDRFDEAITLMERAAELMPGDQRPFFTLGHLYDRKGLREEAAEMFRMARELKLS